MCKVNTDLPRSCSECLTCSRPTPPPTHLLWLEQLLAFVRRVRKFNTDLPGLLDEWAASLFRELDYRHEAANGVRFRELYAHLEVGGWRVAGAVGWGLPARGHYRRALQGAVCAPGVNLGWLGTWLSRGL